MVYVAMVSVLAVNEDESNAAVSLLPEANGDRTNENDFDYVYVDVVISLVIVVNVPVILLVMVKMIHRYTFVYNHYDAIYNKISII